MESFSSDYVVVQFWNPYCEPCGKEVSELNAALAAAHNPTLSVLGIPLQAREQEIASFVRHFQPRYEQWNKSDTRNITLDRVHLTVLLDRNRLPVREWSGTVKAQDLLLEINRLDHERNSSL